MRAKWPAPGPGAATELVETARVTGFSADRAGTGVVVRSERFFTAGGQVSSATVKRFAGLLAAYPHGPVACQVAVPEVQSRVWSRRVAQLIDRFQRLEDPAFPRISYKRNASGQPVPVLRGTAIRVRTIVVAARDWELTPAQVAVEYGISESQVNEVLAFYERYKQAIDASLAAEQMLEATHD